MTAPVAAYAIDSSEAKRIDELKRTVSASRLICWQTCRLKFYFRYVLQIKRPSSAAQYVGSMVHLVLQAWNLARWRNKPMQLADFKTFLEEKWALKRHEINWYGEEKEDQETAWKILERYFAETPIPPDEKPEAVEVSVEADLKAKGLPNVIGIIDLVRKGGVIVDFKTTGQTPNAERSTHLNETQLSCYGVLYRETTGQHEQGFELHQLVKLKKPKLVVSALPTMTVSQEHRLYRIMESYLDGLDRQDWIPSPNPMTCACCEYFTECRAWS